MAAGDFEACLAVGVLVCGGVVGDMPSVVGDGVEEAMRGNKMGIGKSGGWGTFVLESTSGGSRLPSTGIHGSCRRGLTRTGEAHHLAACRSIQPNLRGRREVA